MRIRSRPRSPRGDAFGAQLAPAAAHRRSAPRIACTGTCAASAAASSLSGVEAGEVRHQHERRPPLGGDPPELAQRRASPGGRRCRATTSSLPAIRGAASSTRRPRLDAVRGRGQHPGDVRRRRGGGLLGVAGERAAVDHGQPVRLARVDEQLRHLVVGPGRGELGAAREHAQPVAAGRVDAAAERDAGGELLGELAERARDLDAGAARPGRRSARRCRRPAPARSDCRAAASAIR